MSTKHKLNGFEISEGYNLLMLRAEEGNYDEVLAILNNPKQLDVNASNKKGYTALAIAVKNGSVEIVKALITKSANINIRNNSGQTPLFLACWCNYIDIVRLLLEHGAEINTADQRGWSPLTIAAYHGNYEIVQVLLANNADVLIQDSFGKRAVHRTKDSRIVKLLQAAENKLVPHNSSSPREQPTVGSLNAVQPELNTSMPLINTKAALYYSSIEDSQEVTRKPPLTPNSKSKIGLPTTPGLNSPANRLKQSKTPTKSQWQSDSKADAKRKLSFDTRAAFSRGTAVKPGSPRESVSPLPRQGNQRKSLSRLQVPGTSTPARQKGARPFSPAEANQTEKKDLEEYVNSQLKQTSEQIQELIQQKIALEAAKQIQGFQEKLRKGIESTVNTRVSQSYKHMQNAFNTHLKGLLAKLGFSQEVQTTAEFILEGEGRVPVGAPAGKGDIVKLPAPRDIKMMESNLQRLERNVVEPKPVRSRSKEFRPGRPVPKGKTGENVAKGLKAKRVFLYDFSNEKTTDYVATGTRILEDEIIAGLNGNIDLADEEAKRQFEAMLANKFAQLSEIMGNSSIHSVDVVERTMTEDSLNDRDSKTLLQCSLKILSNADVKDYIHLSPQEKLINGVLKQMNSPILLEKVLESPAPQNQSILKNNGPAADEDSELLEEGATDQVLPDVPIIEQIKENEGHEDIEEVPVKQRRNSDMDAFFSVSRKEEDLNLSGMSPNLSANMGSMNGDLEFKMENLKKFYLGPTTKPAKVAKSQKSLSSISKTASVSSPTKKNKTANNNGPQIPGHAFNFGGQVIHYEFGND